MARVIELELDVYAQLEAALQRIAELEKELSKRDCVYIVTGASTYSGITAEPLFRSDRP